jgi:hypothetical protein
MVIPRAYGAHAGRLLRIFIQRIGSLANRLIPLRIQTINSEVRLTGGEIRCV